MARRFFSVLLICMLVTLPSTGGLSAQDASPVPVESAPSEIPTIEQLAEPADDLISAEFVGNTPAGFYSDNQIYVRDDVYFNIFQVTVGGQTDIVDGTNGLGVFDAPGYRADNAKVITLWTNAEYTGSFKLCVIFESGRFANPSTVELLQLQSGGWASIISVREGNTICAYTPVLGVFAVAEPGSTPATETSVPATSTMTALSTSTSTPSATPTASPSATGTVSETATSTSNPIHFALPNVYITYPQTPVVGNTGGEERAAGSMPSLPATYIASNAWFFSVSSTVSQPGNKRLCVVFETAPYTDPHMLTLLRWTGSGWAPLSGTILDSLLAAEGTICGYTSAFGDFALVERATATATATRTPSSTASPTWTPSSTGTPSVTRTLIPSASATPTPSTTPSPSSSSTSTHTATATASSTPTATSTATLNPGSFATGTLLRTTTRVNVRSASSTTSPSLGVLASGATVTVIGSTVSASGLNWVPVSSELGDGWIAGSYLAVVPTVTPTRTPAPPTMTRTSGPSTATRTATRPAGGFIAGDAVRTTSNVNLRSSPSSSATILQVVPSKTEAIVTGPGVVSGGIAFYPVTISGYPAGYLAGSYLQRISATATPSRTRTPTATVVGSTVRYTTGNVNLRKGPGTNYAKVAMLPEGTRVNITGASRKVNGVTWYPIIVNNVGSGWVSGAFLTTLPPL